MLTRSLELGTASYLDLLKKVLTASVYDESAWQILEHYDNLVDSTAPETYPSWSPKRWIRDFLISELGKRDLRIVKLHKFDPAARENGRDWPMFGFTMVGHKRLDNVRSCIEDVIANNVPGDFAECGVWRGGTSIFARAVLKAYGVTDRKVWLADSFEGMPVPKSKEDGFDLSGRNYLTVSIDQVKANFEKFGLLDDQVKFLKGWFSDTLPTAPIEQLAILRLDGDLYSSTMDTLTNLYPKVSVGGYVIIDDYTDWEMCQRAVTDYIKNNNIKAELKSIDSFAMYWQRT
jgi:hypothetical protein